MSHVAIIAGINKTRGTNASWSGYTVTHDAGAKYKASVGLKSIYPARVNVWQDHAGCFFIETQNGQKIPCTPAVSMVGTFNFNPPDPNTADSVPPTDYTDTQWSCQDWILWHKANVTAYGQPVANQKFVQYASMVSSLASDHFCPYESSFAAYFTGQGINFDNPLASLYVGTSNAASSAGTVLTNAGSGIASASSILTWLLPLALIGGAGYLSYEYIYKPSQRRTQMAGIRKSKKKHSHGKR
jgi:hypothetical protein